MSTLGTKMKDNALIDKKAYQLAKGYFPAQSIKVDGVRHKQLSIEQ